MYKQLKYRYRFNFAKQAKISFLYFFHPSQFCSYLYYSAFLLSLFFSSNSRVFAQYVGHVSSIVMDVNGKVISAQDPDLRRYPASLTKMMTLYMAFRALHANAITLDQRIPVSVHASSMEPSKLGLRAGMEITVREAILGLVTKSANDAACTLGEFIGGGDENRFAEMMTQQAKVLGMTRTQFENASGLPNPDQLTTARDMATLARHIITDFPEYYAFFKVPYFYFRGQYVSNHDPLLKTYTGADGLKTGYTAAAGHNLVSSAVQGNVRLVGTVLGATSNNQRNQIMMSALDDGFVKSGITPTARPILLAHSARGKRLHSRSRLILARAQRYSKRRSSEVAIASGRSSVSRKHLHNHLNHQASNRSTSHVIKKAKVMKKKSRHHKS